MIKSLFNAGRVRYLPAAMYVLAGVAAYVAVAIATGILGLDRFSVMGLTPVQCIVAGVLVYFIVDTLRLLWETAVWTVRGVKFARQRTVGLRARISQTSDRQDSAESDTVLPDAGEPNTVTIDQRPVAVAIGGQRPPVKSSGARRGGNDPEAQDDQEAPHKDIADILKRFAPNQGALAPSSLVRGATGHKTSEHGTSDDRAVDNHSGKRADRDRRERAHKEVEDSRPLQEAEDKDDPEPGDPFPNWARTRIDEGEAIVSAAVLIEKSGGDPSPKTFRRDLIKAANRLGRKGLAIVPDQRLGYLHGGGNGPVRLLTLPAQLARIETVSSEYAHAALTVTLLAVVMHSDGHVAREEAAVLEGFTADTPGLNDAEAARLEAWCAYLVEHPIAFSRLVRRLKAVDIAQRSELFVRAVQMAQADHSVHPSEVEVLEKLCRALEMPLAELYGALGVWRPTDVAADKENAASPDAIAGANEDENTDGPAIEGKQSQAASEVTSVRLNQERVASIEVDTAKVAGLLSDVFLDNEEETAEDTSTVQEVTEGAGTDGRDGLDAAHRVLLARLLEQRDLSRETFNEIARGCDLMPDGAIETLNDWSFECFDDEIIEGDDTIVVNTALIGKLEMEGVDGGNETDKAARA